MSDYTFTENELTELKEVFFTEAYEILESLDQEVLGLESGQDRESALKTIQRHLHTLKGNSRALGFTCLNTLTHKSEDLLRSIQDSGVELDQGLIDLLFAINDTLHVYLDGYRSNAQVALDERLIERIEGRLSANGNGSHPAASEADGPAGPAAAGRYTLSVLFDPQCEMRPSGARIILDRLSAMGTVLGVEPALESDAFSATESFTINFSSGDSADAIRAASDIPGVVRSIDVRLQDQAEQQQKQEQRSGAARDEAVQSLRVDSQRVDKMLNLVGELVIGRSMVDQVLTELEDRFKKNDLIKRLGDANAFMEKTLSQLQKNVMKIRMLPIYNIFRKFPRVVRDLAVEKGKQVELVMQGEKTELDKSILDVIGEPLIHLVRNAVDHGIEMPDERERKGKQRAGSVTLRAAHEGNQIVITISDDGAGLDPQRLRRKAVEKGIKTQDETERLSDDEVTELIFLSGFSTADVVTDISGRGFGMDIVRTTVEALKGRIQVKSRLGEGTVVTLRLPLTLAIMRAMLFWAGGRLFALPMTTVERIARIREGDIQSISGRDSLRFRDRVISLISLDDSLQFRTADGGQKRRFVLVVGLGEKLFGFLVDRLVGQQELVIKALDNHCGTVNCTSGAAILGNGKVVLILDAPALIAREMRREQAKA